MHILYTHAHAHTLSVFVSTANFSFIEQDVYKITESSHDNDMQANNTEASTTM